MTTRVEQFATQFKAVNDELIETVTGCTDEQWRRPTTEEGWSVGVVAHHIGVSQQAFSQMVGKLASGESVTPNISLDSLHKSNAQHARDFADVGKPETLDILQTSGTAITQQLRGLDDEQLDRTAGVFGGQELTVAQVVELVVIGHAGAHLASMRDTISG